jgi:hypothetical protein
MSHFEGASTFLTPKLSLAALGTIISRSFLNSGTLIVIDSSEGGFPGSIA